MKRSNNVYVLPASARSTHIHKIGQPGTGKSRGLESDIMQDVVASRGAGVLDPHGELFDHLVSRLARLARAQPGLAERVVIIDPMNPTWTVGFNPLETMEGIPPERQASFLSDVIVKIAKLESTGRTLRLLNFTFAALAELHLNLVALPRFLVEPEWREQQLLKIRHPDILQYFRHEFPSTRGGVHEWVTPVLNRIGQFLFDPALRVMFSIPSTIRFRDILDRGLILLVNLSKGHLGEANSALLGAFIVASIQKAALARATRSTPRPYFLYLDEFQNYTTDNIKDILSESRKYGLSLVLAHQFLDQLSPELLGAVLNTAGTLVCFRVGYRDATYLAHELFAPGSVMRTHSELELVRFGPIPIPIPVRYQEPLADRDLVTLLTHLKDREFWARQRGPYPPVKQRTFDMPAPVESESLWEARRSLLESSRQRYGRLKSEIGALEQHEQFDPAAFGYYEEIPPPALPAGA